MNTLSTFTYRKQQQLKKQQRIVKIAIFMLVCFVVTGISVFHGSVAVGENRIPQTVIVEDGDSLWAIAANNLPDGEDIRHYIEQIRRHNELTSAIVYPGQILELP